MFQLSNVMRRLFRFPLFGCFAVVEYKKKLYTIHYIYPPRCKRRVTWALKGKTRKTEYHLLPISTDDGSPEKYIYTYEDEIKFVCKSLLLKKKCLSCKYRFFCFTRRK